MAGQNPQELAFTAPSGGTMRVFVAWPDGSGPFPVILVLHGTIGFEQPEVQAAQRFAQDGFITVAACWFEGNHFTGHADPPDPIPCVNGPTFRAVSQPAVRDVQALIDMAQRLQGAKTGKVGVWGNSRGASLAIVLGSFSADVGAAVASSAAYTAYGTGSHEITPISQIATLHAPVLILHGTADTTILVQQAHDYEAALQAAKKPYEAHYYDGAPHGVGLRGSTVPDATQRAVSFFRKWLV